MTVLRALDLNDVLALAGLAATFAGLTMLAGVGVALVVDGAVLLGVAIDGAQASRRAGGR